MVHLDTLIVAQKLKHEELRNRIHVWRRIIGILSFLFILFSFIYTIMVLTSLPKEKVINTIIVPKTTPNPNTQK